MSAAVSRFCRSASAMMSWPSMPSVPLMSARPSFSARVTGSIPASASSSGTGRSVPSGPTARPSPMSTSAQWASGARSPEQPNEPNSCTTGVMPALSTASMVSRVSTRMPVCPDARVLARRNISARTTSRSTVGPVPAAWERTRDFCSRVRFSRGMCLLASAPKPVEIPYAGTSDAASSSMWRRTLATCSRASSVSSTRASWRATAITSPTVTPEEPSCTVVGRSVSKRVMGKGPSGREWFGRSVSGRCRACAPRVLRTR